MVADTHRETTQEDRLITILGPTATGKTSKAVALANLWQEGTLKRQGEIISADSRQVYRGMDLGTGKDLEEYGDIRYHLIDICKAGEKYNLHRYVKDFHETLSGIKSRGNLPILCGGTGMYLETVLSGIRLPEVPENNELRKRLEGLDLQTLTEILKKYKTLHNTTDVDTPKRAIRAIEIEEFYISHPELAQNSRRETSRPLDSVIIGIDIPREIRRQRITERLKRRLDSGMVKEVESILASGVASEDLIYYGLEYKYLTLFVIGKISYDQMVKELEIAIHQFAKRQMTWFRGMERRGFKINWLPYDMDNQEFFNTVKNLYEEV